MGRLVLACLLAIALPVFCQTESAPPANGDSESVKTLRALVESITSLRAQFDLQSARAKSGETEAIKDTAKREADSIQQRLAQAQRDFESVATGVDERAQQPAVLGKLDLAAEFNELLGPLMQEMKQVTEQPRVIEQLRGEVRADEQRLDQARRAVKNVEALLKGLPKAKEGTTDAAMKKALQESQKRWQATANEAQGKLEASKHRLTEALAKRKSIWQIVTTTAKGFLMTRGLNLVLAVITFALAFIGWRSMHRWVRRLSPWHRGGGERSFFARVLDVVYHALAFVVGAVAALVVLYTVGDWLLLGLGLITLLALLLAAKNGLPHYYTQARLILNLGEVREGERIVLNGLPWQVRSLNMVAELVNPALRHGVLRVPTADLTKLSSRPVEHGDLWFPCREEDWVLLADGTFGKVVMVTSEFVQVVQLGGAHRTYATSAFISQNPVNYAGGFRVTAIIKVHPDHRKLATKEIPEALRESIHGGLLTLVEPPQVKSLRVEFRAVIPNAMEFDVTVDFAGEVAEKLPTLQHALQHYALAACNEQGWRLGA